MSSINKGSGGGIHPGAPVIWPTTKEKTKQSESVQQSQSSEESQASTTSISTSSSAAQAASTAASSSAAQATAAQAQETTARPMSMSDVVEQLLKLNIPSTKENQQLASSMMQFGVELSVTG